MADLNTTFYRGEDQYSDGDVEDRILQMVKKGQGPDDADSSDFAVLYHLSPVRENILSWYPLQPDGTALEIGAGPGAVTGVLCRKLKHVTSVDLSLRRCRINYERHKDCGNLDIFAGNLNDMRFGEKFDYVILNGVFEYAGSFTEGVRPYGTFLRKCASFLKEDGVLLIAIENRLGLKYFSGAPEDHTEGYMEGLQGYPNVRKVRTFSKAEWRELAEDAGLFCRQFYYPYPDYKFPSEIFTEESLSADAMRRMSWNFDPRRVELFDEASMAGTLAREGVLGTFMNSFLIELTKGEEIAPPGPRVVYAKISSDRAPGFRIQTVIVKDGGKKKVIKSPLTAEAHGHLRRMNRREKMDPSRTISADGRKMHVRLLEGTELEDGSIEYPYLEGVCPAALIAQAAERGEKEKILSYTDALLSLILRDRIDENQYENCSKFVNVFGAAKAEKPGPLVLPANIDLIFDNLFLLTDKEGEVRVIDGEWIFDFPVPARFILWRAVNELYALHGEIGQVLPEEELLKRYEISPEDAQTYHKWASNFENGYVQANRLARWAKPVRKVSLADLAYSGDDLRLTATLYLDRGRGYSEEDAVHTAYVLQHGRADIVMQPGSLKGVRSLRFDPLEGAACLCEVRAEGCEFRPLNASARRKGEKGPLYEFLTQDPAYRLILKKRAEEEDLCIHVNIRTKDESWALQRSQQLLARFRKIFPVG